MNILVVAGDPSGDLHASQLIKHLRAAGARVSSVGGPLSSRQADEFLEDLASRGVTGFWEPVGKLGFLLRLLLRLRRMMLEGRFHAVVCVDYYGFNRRVLSLAKNAGLPAFYYISPQVWASRPGRIGVLKRLVKKMIVIFPFEEKLYTEAGMTCRFVGHPLLDLLPPPRENKKEGKQLVVGLLPGSRASEISRHLPVLIKSFRLLQASFPGLRGLLFAAQTSPDAAYAAAAGHEGLEVVREEDYRRRSSLDLALSSSGTATLENALMGIPMIVLYKLSWPTYLIAKAIIKVPYISMANILAGRKIVPEFIQGQATAEAIAEEAGAILKNEERRKVLRSELEKLRLSLGQPGAAQRAAEEILSSL